MFILFNNFVWVIKFLFATSIAFSIATVLEFFIHYQLLSWLFVFCLCFYLAFYAIKELTNQIFFLSVGVSIVVLFLLYYYVQIASQS